MGLPLGLSSIPLLNLGVLLGAFALLLPGAEAFTSSVEWLGHHLGVSESATGERPGRRGNGAARVTGDRLSPRPRRTR